MVVVVSGHAGTTPSSVRTELVRIQVYPLTFICRTRHHYGPDYSLLHEPRDDYRVGGLVPIGQAEWLGSRSSVIVNRRGTRMDCKLTPTDASKWQATED
jgi:hypothetical protein